jgi:succinate dehydrogenase/fumarate reductase-like Fe-S protein
MYLYIYVCIYVYVYIHVHNIYKYISTCECKHTYTYLFKHLLLPIHQLILYIFCHLLAAKKAKFACNYGCEEGKCGSCELKVNGKTKIRSCIAKVPAVGPVILTEL